MADLVLVYCDEVQAEVFSEVVSVDPFKTVCQECGADGHPDRYERGVWKKENNEVA